MQLVSVQPDTPLHGLEGLKHMESAIVPGIYDPALADVDMRVGTEEAYDSRGASRAKRACSSASRAAPRSAAGARRSPAPSTPAVIVMIFCDGGEKYLSERFWEEPAEGSIVGGVN